MKRLHKVHIQKQPRPPLRIFFAFSEYNNFVVDLWGIEKEKVGERVGWDARNDGSRGMQDVECGMVESWNCGR